MSLAFSSSLRRLQGFFASLLFMRALRCTAPKTKLNGPVSIGSVREPSLGDCSYSFQTALLLAAQTFHALNRLAILTPDFIN